MHLIGRRVVGGLVGLALVVGGVSAVAVASSGGTSPEAKAAAAGPLGRVTALAWGVQTPVGRRLALQPYVSFYLPPATVRALRASKPRLSGSFVTQIVTAPARGRGRKVVAVSRRASGLALGISLGRSIAGGRVWMPRWTLTPGQTRAVRRAAARSSLTITVTARYRVSYTNARRRTVTTPARSVSTTLPMALKRRGPRGGDLRKLAVTFRQLLGQVEQLKTACDTRNTILRQLRSTYSTMVSGDRSGAAAMLRVYIGDAASMRSEGLLGPDQATMLGSGLRRVFNHVGFGRSRRIERTPHWAALPSCVENGQARAHSAVLIEAVHAVVKRVRKMIRRGILGTSLFEQGTFQGMRQLRKAMWPDDPSEPDVNVLVPDGDTAQPSAASVLDDLKGMLDAYLKWGECCLATNPGDVAGAWNAAMKSFNDNRWRFQLGPPHYSQTYQVQLLPLFAEYTNMYLQLLREGVVNGPAWGMPLATTLSLEDQIRAELDPNNPASAMGYTNRVYNAGLALSGSSTDPQKDFSLSNAYKREMRLQVLDMRDMWYLQDPMGYPYGDPNFKQDRIIYSDAIGSTGHTFSLPPNPSTPLSGLTVWTTRILDNDQWYYHYNQNWVTSIQADNSPQVGARTGATTTGTPSATYNVAPGSTPGPVTQVGATWDQRSATAPNYDQRLIGTVRFYLSDGTHQDPGGNFYKSSSYTGYASNCCTSYWQFDDEVLAAAKIMGSYGMTSSKDVGDSLVLGFRQADSFSSQWKGSLPGKLGAPNTQACVAVEPVAITSGTTTGSRANGAAIQMRACSNAWEQTWKYVDYDDPNDPGDDAAQRDLSVYGGTMCAAPKDGATTPGTPVQVYYCNGTPAQNWTRNAADGRITHDQSQLCLERAGGAVSNGTPIRLSTCNGSDAQKWTWPS